METKIVFVFNILYINFPLEVFYINIKKIINNKKRINEK
jgi:hypothetical protein